MTNDAPRKGSLGNRPKTTVKGASSDPEPQTWQHQTSIHYPLCSEAMFRTYVPSRILIASLGNPAPYLETRHSAGHLLLKSLAHALSCPPFSKDREYAKALITRPFEKPEWLLWQSPSLMNVSGPPLRDALRTFIRAGPSSAEGDSRVGLVLLHDDLESSPGRIRERAKNTSHQGHNGLKSVRTTLTSSNMWDKLCMIKIGIGIGRPESRQGKDVSDYVLAKMKWEEKQQIEDNTEHVLGLIEAFAQKIGSAKSMVG